MKILKIFLVLATVALISNSCMPSYLQHDSINIIKKGMKKNEFIELMDEEIKHNFTVQHNNRNIDILVYLIQESTYERTSTDGSTSIWPVFSNMLFAFNNDKLIYWGLIQEFKKASDPEIVEIGKKAFKIIKIEEDEE